MTPGSGFTPSVAGPGDDDLARALAERDRLQAEVDGLRAALAVGARGRPAGRPQRAATVALVILTSIVFAVAVAGVWARRNALDTDRWVATVAPLPEDPEVRAALSTWITTEVMGVVDAEQLFESVLPERGQVLAGPMANAVRGFVDDQVEAFLASDAFEDLWLAVNRRAHAQVVALLEGDLPPSLQIEGDDVVLNLVPVLNRVLAEIDQASPEIFGRAIDVPTITVDEIPQVAVAKIEDAIGRDLPDDFGQFTVFDSRQLRHVQDAVSLFERVVVVAAVLAVVLIVVTLWVSPHRRRTLLQLVVGIALGIVLLRRLGLRVEDDVVALVRPENRAAAETAAGAFVSSLLDATAWILGIAATVAAVAILTGPYRPVVALRRQVALLGRSAVAAAGTAVGQRPDERTVAWVTASKEALQLGGVVAAMFALLLLDLSWPGILVTLLLVGAFEVVVQRIVEGAPGSELPEAEPVAEPQ